MCIGSLDRAYFVQIQIEMRHEVYNFFKGMIHILLRKVIQLIKQHHVKGLIF